MERKVEDFQRSTLQILDVGCKKLEEILAIKSSYLASM